MAKDSKRIPDFDDIIFETRNREYGAYVLRKKYAITVIISLLIGIIIMTAGTITPFINERSSGDRHEHAEIQVKINMENLEKPDIPKVLIPQAPPPPPPGKNIIKQIKYVAPVVVDSVKVGGSVKLMTASEAQIKVNNSDTIEAVPEGKEEVQEQETEPFLSAEEMPVPEGGESGLYKYIAENTKYPKIALENHVQGKVYVRFCVTSKGSVDKVSVIKGVDPELNAEAIRVVKSFPTFKPGKMNGKPVPVWYMVHIDFILQ
jgi:protein TonB